MGPVLGIRDILVRIRIRTPDQWIRIRNTGTFNKSSKIKIH
jgi:hypothetical protein